MSGEEKKKVEQETLPSDNIFVRTCKNHGDLYTNDLIKSGIHKNGTQRTKCKKCMKDLHEKNYKGNKEKILANHARYRAENPEKVRKIKSISTKKNRHKYRVRENERKRLVELKGSRELSDRYVKKLIVKRRALAFKDVPDEMIPVVRTVHILKRILRQANKLTKEGENKDGED